VGPSGGVMIGTATATALILGCGVVTGLVAARSLGPVGRGELAAVTVWASTLVFAGACGLSDAVAYFAAADRKSQGRVWTTGQLGAIGLGLVVAAAGWWLIPIAFRAGDPSLGDAIRRFVIVFAAPSLGLACATAWLQGAGFMHSFNITRASVHIVNAAGMTALMLAGSRSVTYFAGTMVIGTIAGWLLASRLGPAPVAPPSIDLARRMLRYGLRAQVGNWSNTISLRLDQLLLSLFAAPASLGLYVVGVSYANVLLTIPGSAALVMFPEIVQQHTAGAGRVCLERWYRRMLWATLPAAVIIGLSGVIIIPTVFGSAFQPAVPLLALLTPTAVLIGMNDILSTAFLGAGRPGVSSRSELVGLAVTIAALAALLPRYGIYGAAAASLLAQIAMHVYLLRRAIDIFGAELRPLCCPTRDDVIALRTAGIRARHTLTRYLFERSVTADNPSR
jgi:O-antigen/teichoic acid export membrane protein